MENSKLTTEESSKYHHLEKMGTLEILTNINDQDKQVALAVEKQLPMIGKLVDIIVSKMRKGGRLFYIGAGTSGRLGVLDASECPPTFGVDKDKVIGIIAGGDKALREAVENAEDNVNSAWQDLQKFNIDQTDVLVGIAASGTTPYVIGGVKKARRHNITTACITCNRESPLSLLVDYPIEPVVGAEFVTGSTRMKAGTAQKLVLNMISTALMIKLGRVLDNKMVDMQLSNEKLTQRGIKMLMEQLNISQKLAQELLLEHGGVREVLEIYNQDN